MRLILFFLLLFAGYSYAQLPFDEQQYFSRLSTGSALPEKLLSTRSVVFHPPSMTSKELELIQSYLQRTGIDAVVYFENDLLTAGRDVSVAMAQYLNSREIANLVLFQKKETAYTIYITEYNGKANFTEPNQATFTLEDRLLEEILKKVYRTALGSLKKENMLINEFPEAGSTVNPIAGRRNEFYAVDLKVDPLAVPKFGNGAMDAELEEIMKSYPYKYKLTDPTVSEADLRKQGYLFVLRFVRARAKIAKSTLGFDIKNSESAIVSITYPGSEPQLKNIPANKEVFKFYFKHIESGNVYLGNKWDADLSWQQALINQIKGYRLEFRIN